MENGQVRVSYGNGHESEQSSGYEGQHREEMNREEMSVRKTNWWSKSRRKGRRGLPEAANRKPQL